MNKKTIQPWTKLYCVYFVSSDNCAHNMVSFGNQRCDISNCSASWIQCKTSSAFVTHQVSNDGKDPLHGKGYAWSQPFLTINVGDSVNWSWKPPVSPSQSFSFTLKQINSQIFHSNRLASTLSSIASSKSWTLSQKTPSDSTAERPQLLDHSSTSSTRLAPTTTFQASSRAPTSSLSGEPSKL